MLLYFYILKIVVDLVTLCDQCLELCQYTVDIDPLKHVDRLRVRSKNKLVVSKQLRGAQYDACFVPNTDRKEIIVFNTDSDNFRSSWKWVRICDNYNNMMVDEEKTNYYQSLYKDVKDDSSRHRVGHVIYEHYLIAFYCDSLKIFVFNFEQTQWLQSAAVKCVQYALESQI